MGPLTLYSFDLGMYNDKVALAGICYGSSKQLHDHQGKRIGTNKVNFEKHLETDVMPIIAQGLKNSPYQYVYLDYMNQAPQPYLAICRIDKAPLEIKDLQAIKQLLDATLKTHNEKCAPHKANLKQESTNVNQQHYGLRPRH
jgi:hypothetical protein